MSGIIILYIIIALLVIGFLTLIHEFGHFICAKMFGVPIREFSIGMGPQVFSKIGKKSGTKYGIRLFPIGGFVSMEGENGTSEDPNAFNNINPWKKIIITVAGPVVNIIFAFIVMFFIVIFSKTLVSTTIGRFNDDALSNGKLMIGDEIVKVGKTHVYTGREVVYEIMNQGDEAIDITVVRNGETLLVEDVVFPTIKESGVWFGEVDFKLYTLDSLENVDFFDYLSQSFHMSISAFKMIWDSIIGLITGRFGMQAVSGPVGMTGAIGQAAQNGLSSLMYLVVVISMNLGVFNLLPIPALDGGHLVFHLIDAVAGRKVVKKETEDMIHTVGIMILFAFMILISFKDIFSLFR